MDLDDSVKAWSDISGRDDVRAIYSEGAVDGQTLPWEVRSALGDFLCEAVFDDSLGSQQKSAFLTTVTEHLVATKNKVAQEQWHLFTGLKLRDGNGILRKHTKKSLYFTLKSCVDKERKLVENEDISQFLDDSENEVPKISQKQYTLNNSDSYDDVGDDMEVDAHKASVVSTSNRVPECAVKLFEQLSQFT